MTRARYRAGKRLWSKADDAALRRLYQDLPTSVVATRLRRTLAATYGRAQLLELAKSAAYLASPAACRLRRGDKVGAASRFLPGHVPANKGLRRPGWSAGRMQETQFKAGTLNGQAALRFRPVGSTRVADGYLYRKLSDTPNVPWTKNWTLEHILVWTSVHGPVPPGHAIAFRNGNKADVWLDNLECVPKATMMLRNSVHNLPAPLKQAIQLLGAVKRQIRRRDPHAAHD